MYSQGCSRRRALSSRRPMCVLAGPVRIGVNVSDEPIGHTGRRRNKTMTNPNDPAGPGRYENTGAQSAALASPPTP
jgi:hypothetical protein